MARIHDLEIELVEQTEKLSHSMEESLKLRRELTVSQRDLGLSISLSFILILMWHMYSSGRNSKSAIYPGSASVLAH